MEIKKLEKKDIPALARMLGEYWRERAMIYQQKWAENYLMKGHATEIKKEIFIVAKEKEKVIGSISVIIWEGKVAELRDFVVKEEFRGRGIGRKLFEEAIKFCKKNKARKIFSLAFPEYEEMLKRRGFFKEGLLREHFAKKEDLIIMSKFLK